MDTFDKLKSSLLIVRIMTSDLMEEKEKVKMTNKLAVSSNFFKQPSITKWESALLAGITDVELSLSFDLDIELTLGKAHRDYDLLEKSGMTVSSIHLPFGRQWDISMRDNSIYEDVLIKLRALIDWAAKREIGIAVLHASAEPIRDEDRAYRLSNAMEAIEILGAYANDGGVSLAIENLPRTCLGNSAEEMLILTDNGNKAKICFDVNHLFIDSHSKFIQETGPLIITTHFSDYDRIDERHWLVGEGCIDWPELIDMLGQQGYKGRFLFEINELSSPSIGRAVTPKELVERFIEVSKISK